jgi:hypothetical protein
MAAGFGLGTGGCLPDPRRRQLQGRGDGNAGGCRLQRAIE